MATVSGGDGRATNGKSEQQPALAHLLASGSGITLVLGALLSLIVVYTLVLFIKNLVQKRQFNGADQDNSNRRSLCRTCSLRQRKQFRNNSTTSLAPYCSKQKIVQQEGSRAAATSSKRLGEIDKKCWNCSCSIDENLAATTFGCGDYSNYGTHGQHPIIFGKSKDSILVPEFKQAVVATSSNDISSSKQHIQASGKTHTTSEQVSRRIIDNYNSNQDVNYTSNSDNWHQQQSVSTTDSGLKQCQLFSSGSGSESNNWQRDNLLIDFNQQQQQQQQQQIELLQPTSTTRVLTDEKGHSIKIRIASPPPQRSSSSRVIGSSNSVSGSSGGGGGESGIINLIQQFRDSSSTNLKRQQQQQVIVANEQRQQRDSLASDCPLIPSGSGRGDSGNHGNSKRFERERTEEEEEEEEQEEQEGQKTKFCGRLQHDKRRRVSAIARGTFKEDEENKEQAANINLEQKQEQQRRHSEVIQVFTTSTRDHEQRLSTIGGREGRDGANKSTTRTATAISDLAPIEPFNDSNTSEFDDDFGGDSRQDTSLDYVQQQQYQKRQSGVISSNEQVLDSDLRQANKMNLELALLQSVGASKSSSLGNHSSLRRSLRAKSSIGASSYHHHFPQSGYLTPASEYSQEQQQQQQQHYDQTMGQQAFFSSSSIDQQQQRTIERKSSEEDDSCLCRTSSIATTDTTLDESRRSSCISGSHTNSASNSPISCFTTAAAAAANQQQQQHSCVSGSPLMNFPFVRIEITKRKRTLDYDLGGSVANNCTAGSDSDSKWSSGRGGGILYSLANTIGRSRSSDFQASKSEGKLEYQEFADEYEINIIEAKNVLHRRLQATGGSPQPKARNISNRRDSFLATLVAAATSGSVNSQQQSNQASQSPSSKRRASLEGCVFARIFKQAGDDHLSSAAAAAQQNQQQQLDCVSLHSSNSQQQQQQQQTAEYLQLPLIKIPTDNEIFENQQQVVGDYGNNSMTDVNFAKLAHEGSYSFTCKSNEFPLRLSIYLAAGKRGARYTLGHCILSLEDFKEIGNVADQKQQQTIYRSNLNSKKYILSPVKLNDCEPRQRNKLLLDYRLHQTILEAIKSTV